MLYLVEPMRLEDIPEVMSIERGSFAMSWPASAYRRELLDNRLARYIVVRERSDEPTANFEPRPAPAPTSPGALRQVVSSLREWVSGARPLPPPASGDVVGYLGLWMMVDEAHITTVAVRPTHRRRGIGDLLLLSAIDQAAALHARVLTLEVRVSNRPAQAMYEKFSFSVVGVRPRYYSDNQEDAFIMTSADITSADFQARLQAIRRRSQEKLGAVIIRLPEV